MDIQKANLTIKTMSDNILDEMVDQKKSSELIQILYGQEFCSKTLHVTNHIIYIHIISIFRNIWSKVVIISLEFCNKINDKLLRDASGHKILNYTEDNNLNKITTWTKLRTCTKQYRLAIHNCKVKVIFFSNRPCVY